MGIQTWNYVCIKMPGLVQLIAAMGGITVTLYAPNYGLAPDEASATQYADIAMRTVPDSLDGPATLRYVRARLETNDFDRTWRLQQVISAVRQRFLDLTACRAYPKCCPDLGGLVEMDLSSRDIVRLAWFGAGLKPSAWPCVQLCPSHA